MAAEQGMLQLFSLMAMISLNLGLLNLMPIPVLDGGHIAILALEGVSRRDFSMKVKEKMLLAGFVLLLMLMVTVIYNDLTRDSVDRTADAVAVDKSRVKSWKLKVTECDCDSFVLAAFSSGRSPSFIRSRLSHQSSISSRRHLFDPRLRPGDR